MSTLLARIRQRQSLYRLAFDDRRVTRAMLRAQAEAFEDWLVDLENASRSEPSWQTDAEGYVIEPLVNEGAK